MPIASSISLSLPIILVTNPKSSSNRRNPNPLHLLHRRCVFHSYFFTPTRFRLQIQCRKCGDKSQQNERMMDLIVDIEGDIETLEEALDKLTCTEIVDGGVGVFTFHHREKEVNDLDKYCRDIHDFGVRQVWVLAQCWLKKQRDPLALNWQEVRDNIIWTSSYVFGKGEVGI